MENTNNVTFTSEQLKQLKQLASDYKTASALEKEAKEAKEKAGNAIKSIMGDCEKVYVSEYTIDYKPVTKTTIDSKALKADVPELYVKYSKEQITRPLYVR